MHVHVLIFDALQLFIPTNRYCTVRVRVRVVYEDTKDRYLSILKNHTVLLYCTGSKRTDGNTDVLPEVGLRTVVVVVQ